MSPRRRPSLFVRGLEMAGLALVVYGLGAFRFGPVVLGGAAILGSYALYRKAHGAVLPPGPGSGRDSDDGQDVDGGGE